MLVPMLLLGTLEELLDDDLKMLKWYLSMHVSGSCAPIPRSHLDKASRTETVSKMIERYGEEDAVNITIEILKKMNFNDTAGKLENKYTGAVDDEILEITYESKKPKSLTFQFLILCICIFSSTEGKTATPTTSSTAVESRAAPFTMSAQQGGVIIAPTVTSTSGSLNITFNK